MPKVNPRIVMPFGGGLDRESGVLAMRPASFEDLQNVLLHQGKASIRPGFTVTASLLDDEDAEVSHVLQGDPLLSEQGGVSVSFQQATEKVWVHRLTADGTSAVLIGEWVHDQGGWGTAPPVIVMSESYGNIFMAHDERTVVDRAKTIYYDGTTLVDLEGDFLGAGNHKIRFRGVIGHLAFLFGWGYGDEALDRPELVRSSRAGDPTDFAANHYFIIGDRGVPVLAAGRAGTRGMVLQIFKQNCGHVIVGTGRDNFGVFEVDPNFGCLNSGLTVTFGGVLFAWSAEGPRAWFGAAPSEEVSIPLDLAGLEPAALVAEGEVKRAFAHYIPRLRVVAFVFGQRVYALTVRVEGDWKWSYWPLGFEAYCGFTMFSPQELIEAPTGFPNLAAALSGGTYSDITVNNVDQDGDETLELWVQEDPAGAWALNASALVTIAAQQIVQVDSLSAGTVYNVSGRYRRGGLYADAYQGTPDTWPQTSQIQITTTIDPPTPVSGVWSRTSGAAEQILLTVTPATGLEANDIEVFRGMVSIGLISGPHVGDAEFTDTTALGLTGEVLNSYTFTTEGGTDSPHTSPLVVWSGPPGTPAIAWGQGTGPAYEVGFDTPDPTLPTEVWDNYDDAGGLGASTLRTTAAAGAASAQVTSLVNVPVAPGLEVTLFVRQKQTLFAVDDFSQYSFAATVVIQDPWV